MSSFDNLNAPQFSTFDDSLEGDPESYFRIDHENEFQRVSEEFFYTPSTSNQRNNERVVANDVEFHEINEIIEEKPVETKPKPLRRSASSGSLVGRRVSTLENLNKNENRNVYGQLNKGRSSSQTRLRACSQESLNRLAAPKNKRNEFVSVAEAIRKFEQQLPPRFHSVPKNTTLNNKNFCHTKPKPTIPQSPALLTKNRIKPTENVLTHEERELLRFEEEKKQQFKANPVNKRIFGPLKAFPREVKTTTVQPFNLKEVVKKEEPKIERYEFHAKPIPKSVIEPPKLPEKKPIKITNPVTPKCAKNIPKRPESTEKKKEERPPTPLKKTVPNPFSFEKRDKELFERKEKMIMKVLEEERKMREFHAKPIAKHVVSLFKQKKSVSQNSSQASLTNNARENNNINNEANEFKARPPSVLYQKPFEPKKPEHAPIEPEPFFLHSEIRAKEREEYERKKREKEEMQERIQREMDEEKLRQTEEEIRKLRKELEFKAKPIRQFKEIPMKQEIKVTEPISPTFRSGKSNILNKENIEP